MFHLILGFNLNGLKIMLINELAIIGFGCYTIKGTYNLNYRDDFSNLVDISWLEWGTPYAYYDSWLNQSVYLKGRILE